MLSLAFFHPALLWALPLAAVPIIIHLLNRRRFNKVPWAAMEYLLRALKRNRRRMQMEHWIILLLRTLAVVFLVFLVTRPQLEQGSGLLETRTHHVICLDDSASMAQRLGAGNLFKAGCDKVQELCGKLVQANAGDLFTLIHSDNPDKHLMFAKRVGQPLLKEVREALDGRLVGDARLGAAELLAAAKKWAAEKKQEARDIHYYLVTDGRERDFVVDGKPAPAVIKHLQEMDPAHERMTLLLVGAKDNSNLGITDIRRLDRLAMAGAAVTLEVEVTNFGDSGAQAAEVAVEIDGKSRVVRPLPPIPAGGKTVVDVEHTFREPGFHGVVASLPKDAYPIDDRRALAVEVVGTSNVVVVNGDPGDGSEPEDSETFYLNAALDVGGDVLSGIAVTEIPPSALAEYDLGHANMVWLANVDAPQPDVVAKLEDFVRGGGGLVMFLGDQTVAEKHNAALYKDGKGLMPLALTELKGDVDKPDPGFVADREHFAIRDHADLLDLLFSKLVLIKRYFEMSTETTEPVAIAVRVRAANGSPLIVSKTFDGGGESVVVGTTADDDWTDFCRSMAFLPVCQEIHKHATRVHSLAPYNLSTRDELVLDLDPAVHRRDVLVRSLEAGEGFEATYTAEDQAAAADGEVTASLRVPMRELTGLGLFQVTLTPNRGEAEQRLVARSAPVEEGILQRLSRAGFLEQYSEVKDRLEVVESSGADDSGVPLAGEGEIWRLLALALLGFLLLETVLAWRFGRR